MASPRGAKRQRSGYSHLACFSYHKPLATLFVPSAAAERATHALLRCLFCPAREHDVFSITASEDGQFFLLDEPVHARFCAATTHEGASQPSATPDLWHCIYLHESAEEGSVGAETSGAISALSEQLAAQQIAVLDVTTLLRNFMLVRLASADLALRALRRTLEPSESAESPPSAPPAAPPPADAAIACQVQLTLLTPSIVIAMLPLEALRACALPLLQLLLFPPAACAPTQFLHLFEMGGEASVMFEERALAALGEAGAPLRDAIAPTAAAGWRVLRVTCAAGHASVGILSAVCRPLAALPLMNVSTLDANYVLIEGSRVDEALERLKPHFDVAVP